MERFFRTVRDQFLVEVTGEAATAISGLAGLNKLLAAWAETVYHITPHSCKELRDLIGLGFQGSMSIPAGPVGGDE